MGSFMDLVEANKQRAHEKSLERKKRNAKILRWGLLCGSVVLGIKAKNTMEIKIKN